MTSREQRPAQREPLLWRRRRFWIAMGILGVIAVVLMINPFSKPLRIATIEVARGEFTIDISAQGEIEALQSTNVSIPRSRRRMSLQIIEMVPEGSIVKKDDFLLQLDTGEAAQAVEKAENDRDTAKAELKKENAAIASNMAQLESLVEREQFSVEQAELSLRMMEYEADAKKREYELAKKKVEVALVQAEQKIVSQKVIDEATLRKVELKIKQAEAELAKAKRTLESLTLNAPTDGLVVYREIWTGSGMKKIQVGDTPWPGMAVMGIPDLSVMIAGMTINEVDISSVSDSQLVMISVEALDSRLFTAKLTRIAPLAHQEQSTNLKVFELEATIDSTDSQLRPGMSCECRIITDCIQDVLFVPLQSVFEKEGETVVYLMDGRKPKRLAVTTGAKNRDQIIITDGLEAGDLICLRDPTIPLPETISGDSESNGFPESSNYGQQNGH
jgi:RND family efflux transporter MFP subunit